MPKHNKGLPAKRVIDQAEYERMVDDHFIYLHGDENKRADFSNCILKGIDMSGDDLRKALFIGATLNTWTDEYPTEDGYHESSTTENLTYTNLEGADFSDADLSEADFRDAGSLKDAIFIGAKFNRRCFTSVQIEQAIFTQKDLVTRFSSTAEEIKVVEKKVEEQGIVLENTSKDAVDKMEIIFETMLERFSREERIWILFVGLTFFAILWLAILPIFIAFWLKGIQYALVFYSLLLFALFYWLASWLLDRVAEEIWTKSPKKSFMDEHPIFNRMFDWLSIAILIAALAGMIWYLLSSGSYTLSGDMPLEKLSVFLPLDIILFIFLYFSVVQYSKAKKLRIEQRNKLAMIQFYVAHEAKGNKEHMALLLPKFADVLIREAMPDRNSSDKNLPIDEIIKIAELAVKSKP